MGHGTRSRSSSHRRYCVVRYRLRCTARTRRAEPTQRGAVGRAREGQRPSHARVSHLSVLCLGLNLLASTMRMRPPSPHGGSGLRWLSPRQDDKRELSPTPPKPNSVGWRLLIVGTGTSLVPPRRTSRGDDKLFERRAAPLPLSATTTIPTAGEHRTASSAPPPEWQCRH